MNKISLYLIVLVSVFSFSCLPNHKHYTADLKVSSEPVESGKPVELTFQIKNPEGEKVSDLEIIHEKPMHLFMVSKDLSQYFHEHPQKQEDGTYRLPFTFPNGGDFKVYIDFTPKDAEQTVESFIVRVRGETLKSVALKPDEKFEKEIDGILVKMKPNETLAKKKDLMLNFQVFDAETKEPVTDLQNYLGEKAHFVIIRKGLGRFVHAHPMSAEDMKEMNSNQNMNKMNMEKMDMSDDKNKASKVSAMTNFPNRGVYKIFAQFKRNDKVITVPFVFEVE